MVPHENPALPVCKYMTSVTCVSGKQRCSQRSRVFEATVAVSERERKRGSLCSLGTRIWQWVICLYLKPNFKKKACKNACYLARILQQVP